MAGETKYRTAPRNGGKYYAIERSFDGGKTWASSGDSAVTQEEAQQKIDNMNKGLTASGLTQEEAKAQAEKAPGPKIGNASPDYKAPAGAKSQWEIDIDSNNLTGKAYDGSYSYSDDSLKNSLGIANASGDRDKAAKIQAELNRREQERKQSKSTTTAKGSGSTGVKKPSDLGGRTTDQWVKDMLASGMSLEELGQAYVKEGYSTEGDKFKAAVKKYGGVNDDKNATTAESGAEAAGAEEVKAIKNALEDTSAQDTALGKKNEATKSQIEKLYEQADNAKEWLTGAEKELIEKYQKREDAAELSKFLPKFAIQHYLDGDFGKRGSAGAIATLGYFILDKVGNAVVNGSLIARGITPGDSTKSALQKYNDTAMEKAFNRDDKNRTDILEKINSNIEKNNDTNIENRLYGIKLGNDMASKYLEKYSDQIDEQAFLEMQRQAADWLKQIPEDERDEIVKLMALKSANIDDKLNTYADVLISKKKATATKNDSDAVVAEQTALQAVLGTTLSEKQIKSLEVEIQKKVKELDLTDAQIAQVYAGVSQLYTQTENLKKEGKLKDKEINWYDTNQQQAITNAVCNNVYNGIKTTTGGINDIVSALNPLGGGKGGE